MLGKGTVCAEKGERGLCCCSIGSLPPQMERDALVGCGVGIDMGLSNGFLRKNPLLVIPPVYSLVDQKHLSVFGVYFSLKLLFKKVVKML